MSRGPRVVGLPAMTERQLEREVKRLADQFGWERYHTHRSDFSAAGFPDETLCRPPRLIFAELKSDLPGARVSKNQQKWLDLLKQCPGVEVYLWRPEDLEDIARILAPAGVRVHAT